MRRNGHNPVRNAFVVKRGYAPQNGILEYSVAGRSAGTAVFLMSFIGRWMPGSVCTVWFVLAAERGMYAQYLTVYTIGAVVQTIVFIALVCAGVYYLICAVFGGFFAMYARMAAEAPELLTVDFAYPHRFESISATLA